MPSYNPFLILAFAGAYLLARLITVRSGSKRALTVALLAGVATGLAVAWLLELSVAVAGQSARAADRPTFAVPAFPHDERLLWIASLGSAFGASFGDWIRRQRAGGIRSPFHSMAPVALGAILVLVPLVVVAVVAMTRPSERPPPAAPSPALAGEPNRALI
jgi:hypothetical protein